MKISAIMLAAGMLLGASGAMAQDAATAALSKPDPNGNLVGLTTTNGRLAYDFVDQWFNKHEAEAAWDKYVSRTNYTGHAVYNSTFNNWREPYAKAKAEESRAAGPTTHFDIKQVVAEGNLVFLHIAASQNGGSGAATGRADQGALNGPPPGAAPGGPPGGAPAGGQPPQGGPGPVGDGKGPDEMVMILRYDNDGKVIDHWDIHVPTNSNSVVFAGLDGK